MLQKCTIPLIFASIAFFTHDSRGGTPPCAFASISVPLALSVTAASSKKKSAPRTRKKAALPVKKPSKRYVTIAEVESRNFYPLIEPYLYRMCIKEVPFLLALYHAYYKDARLDRGDTLVLTKKVLSALLVTASRRFSTGELTVSPVGNIDSMMMYRPKGKRGGTNRCAMIIYAIPGAYEIPNTGARITVPAVLRGTVSLNAKTRRMFVTVFSKGVRLQLPGYAKLLSFGMITDMDVRYAELLPAGNGFEARLMYASQGTAAKKKGWSFNVTECNKIRPYAR